MTLQLSHISPNFRKHPGPIVAAHDAAIARGARAGIDIAHWLAVATRPATTPSGSRGKMLPRDRVQQLLLDPGDRRSSRSAYVRRAMACMMGACPSGGMIAGVGRVAWPRGYGGVQRCHREGRHLFPDHASKSTCARRKSPRSNLLPCIYLVDSAAAPIYPIRTRSFPDRDHFGRIFFQPSSTCRPRGLPRLQW